MAAAAEYGLITALVVAGIGTAAYFLSEPDQNEVNKYEHQEYCLIVEQRINKSDCNDLQRTLTKSEFGTAKLRYPKAMYVNEISSAQLTISYVDKRRLSDNSTSSNIRTEIFQPKVGRHMKAELIAQGIQVKPLNNAEQEISRDGKISWEWELIAPIEGHFTLNFKTSVQGITANGKKYLLIPTVETRNIYVEASFKQKLSTIFSNAIDWLKNIENLILSILAVISAYLALKAAYRKFAKNKRD